MMSPAKQPPKCLALLICETVYRDEVSKNLVIAGVFSEVSGIGFPLTFPRVTVFFTLTEGLGEFEFSLELEHADTMQAVMEFKGPMKVVDPSAIKDFNVKLDQLTFPEPGKYWLTLKADGVPILQRPVFASKSESNEEREA